ncbi:MAG: hypothetical protein PWQ39_187 [Thermacetogenium sp.]|nr:hypothetical protein [Thermacetogenium sp.]
MLFNKRRRETEDRTAAPAPRVRDVVFPDRISEYEDCLKIDDTFCRVMVVSALPEVVHFGFFSALSVLPGVTVSVVISPYTTEEASKKLGNEITVLGSELIIAEKQGNTRRIDTLHDKYAFYRQLLKEVNLRRNAIAAVTIVIMVAAPTYEEMIHRCSEVKDILGATKAVTKYFGQISGFKSVLPFLVHQDEFHDVTIANAACLSPLISLDFSHPSGIYFGRNETGEPVFLDLFIGQPRLNGPHMLIIGMTRSGKSYCCKGLTARSVATGIQTVIIDPEGEYKKLIEELGGTNIRIHTNMPCMFNPFDVEPSYDEEVGWYVDIAAKSDDIVFLIATILETQTGEKISAEERAVAGEAVRAEYKARGITEDPESIYEPGGKQTEDGAVVGKTYKEMPTLSSYAERLKEMGAERLSKILLPFLKGGPQGFFDGQSVGKFYNSHIVCFDISSITSEFTRMYVMYVLLSWIWEKFVKRNRERKRVLVDEAWLLMKHKDTAEFMSQLARRGAKYNTSLTAASQSFREFTTEEGMAFMAQCDTKFFLRMQETDAAVLGKIFNLSPGLVERLSTFQRGQGILRSGKESAIVYFEGFPFEEHFLRSDPRAVLAR